MGEEEKVEENPVNRLQEIVKKLKGKVYYEEDSGRLEVNLYYKKPDEETIRSVIEEVKKVNPLKSLFLDLGENGLGDRIAGYVSKEIAELDLDELELCLKWDDLTDSGVENIANNISKLSNLKRLSICLTGNKISDLGATHLANGISKLSGLEKLNIELARNQIGDKGAKALYQTIRSLSYLKELRIELGWNRIKNGGAKKLLSLAKEMKNIKYFSLDLGWNLVSGNIVKKMKELEKELENMGVEASLFVS